MSCLLCFGIQRDELLIDIISAESRRLGIPFILHTHFRFCFQEEPVDGYVCQKCWIKVSVFHEFYSHIEYVHRSNESIFVECVADDKNPAIESNSDKCSPAKNSSNNAPQSGQKRIAGSYTDESVNLEGFEPASDYADYFNDNFDIDFVDSAAQLNADNGAHNEVLNANKRQKRKIESKTKRGRPQKKKTVTPKGSSNERDERMERNKPKPANRRKNESGTFQCETCELHFLTPSGLDRHIKEIHDVKEFKCDDGKCVDSFDTQQLLDDHIAKKHARVECPHCKKKFLESFIARHIQKIHAASDVVCDLCGKVSLNEEIHTAHVKRAHDSRGKCQCDICGRWYKNRHVLKTHMPTHIYGPTKCDICGHVSPHRRAWVKHKRQHRPGIKDRWKCDVCDRGFREKKRLEDHYHIHTGTAGSHQCKECGKLFRFGSSLSVHRKKLHPK